jgi:uncharacterized membrane protein
MDLTAAARPRVASVDLVRGAVMVFMLLDHARDFVHREGLTRDPTDPATTNAALFFTRWVTHFCAPAFVLLAGVAARLKLDAGATREALAGFLLRRGLFLVALELVVLRPLIWFNLDWRFLAHLQVIWVIGWSMVALAAVVRLPDAVVWGAGLVMVLAHDLLGHVPFASATFPSWRGLWILLHEKGALQLGGAGGPVAFVQYPFVPWIGVLLCGFGLGRLYACEPGTRRRALLGLGIAACVLFVALRALRLYGDPAPWRDGPTALASLFSFLRVEKYPPSLQFLLMTSGPVLMALAVLDGRQPGAWLRPVVKLGRVPLFFYVLQWPAVHLASRLFQWLDGQPPGWDAPNPLLLGAQLPPGCGFALPVVYLAWALCLLALVPLAAAYARFKRRRPHWRWLGYL